MTARPALVLHERVDVGGILDLRDLIVSDVMIHRTAMITVNADEPAVQVVNAVIASPSGTRTPPRSSPKWAALCGRKI